MRKGSDTSTRSAEPSLREDTAVSDEPRGRVRRLLHIMYLGIAPRRHKHHLEKDVVEKSESIVATLQKWTRDETR